MVWLLGSCLMLTQDQLWVMVRVFVLNYGVCVLSESSDTACIQERETWRVARIDSVHSDALSLSYCTSSLCISPSLPLHLWRLTGPWPCADISLLSFLSIAFIVSALLLRLSISNALFLSSTGQSGFVALRRICWGVFMYCMYDVYICKWASTCAQTSNM